MQTNEQILIPVLKMHFSLRGLPCQAGSLLTKRHLLLHSALVSVVLYEQPLTEDYFVFLFVTKEFLNVLCSSRPKYFLNPCIRVLSQSVSDPTRPSLSMAGQPVSWTLAPGNSKSPKNPGILILNER